MERRKSVFLLDKNDKTEPNQDNLESLAGKNDQDIFRDGVAAKNESPIFPNFLTYLAEMLAITGTDKTNQYPRLASAMAWTMNKFINRLNLV